MNETRNRTNMRVWTHLTTAVLLCGGLVSCDRVPEQRSAEHLSLDWSVYIGRVTAARLEEELPLYLANVAAAPEGKALVAKYRIIAYYTLATKYACEQKYEDAFRCMRQYDPDVTASWSIYLAAMAGKADCLKNALDASDEQSYRYKYLRAAWLYAQKKYAEVESIYPSISEKWFLEGRSYTSWLMLLTFYAACEQNQEIDLGPKVSLKELCHSLLLIAGDSDDDLFLIAWTEWRFRVLEKELADEEHGQLEIQDMEQEMPWLNNRMEWLYGDAVSKEAIMSRFENIRRARLPKSPAGTDLKRK